MALKIKLAMPSGKFPWVMLALRVALVGVGDRPDGGLV